MGKKKSIFDIVVSQGKKTQKTVQKGAAIIADQVKDVATGAVDKADSIKKDVERKVLKPVFMPYLQKNIPDIIRVTDHDKVHDSSPVCKKSVGYKDYVKGKRVLNLYTRYAEKSHLQFYPILDEGIYLENPFVDNMYLAVDDYYSYLKSAKLAELTEIAQHLGAKHIKITWEEEEERFTSNARKIKESAEAKSLGKAEGSYDHKDDHKSYAKEAVLYESSFPGASPTKPELKYFASDSKIINLVSGRMHQENPLGKQTLILEQKSSLGINTKDAVAVDATIKKYDNFSASTNSTFTSATEQQRRSKFKYEIEF